MKLESRLHMSHLIMKEKSPGCTWGVHTLHRASRIDTESPHSFLSSDSSSHKVCVFGPALLDSDSAYIVSPDEG